MTHNPTRRFFSCSALLAALTLVAITVADARAVTIPTVPVGNRGNVGEYQFQGTFGAVAYNYRIGTYEVTNAQYAEFLNAKAASDPLALYDTSMGSSLGGIARSGSSGSYSYATISGRGDKPVNYVSWYDSIRFANWLNNNQGSGDTETGAYTLLGGTPTPTNGNSITRNPGATWFLTSQDEWYKAAYHKNDGVTGNYFDYPTSSDTAPTAVAPPGGSNSANYNNVVGNLTDVGAYTGSDSPYGTFDQGGNLEEWNESLITNADGPQRGHRGISFSFPFSSAMRSSEWSFDLPEFGINRVGFRVATGAGPAIPEPSTAVLAILACGIMWMLRKRFK
jgi:formylglycine-generating enzyme required for sulfatase activity